jgi:hypothetical protein
MDASPLLKLMGRVNSFSDRAAYEAASSSASVRATDEPATEASVGAIETSSVMVVVVFGELDARVWLLFSLNPSARRF